MFVDDPRRALVPSAFRSTSRDGFTQTHVRRVTHRRRLPMKRFQFVRLGRVAQSVGIVERLECRRLLASAIVTPDGTLVVTGTEGDDLISALFDDEGNYRIEYSNATSQTFALTEFNDVVFNLLGGIDTLNLDH